MWASKPKKINTIDLVSSNLPVGSQSEYIIGSTYSKDVIVKVSFELDGITPLAPVHIYKSLTDANTGNYPPGDIAHWENQGTTNRWSMFDEFLNTESSSVSTNPGEIVVTINSSLQDTIYLFGITGTSVKFELFESSGVLVSEKYINLDTLIHNMYEYYYTKFTYTNQASWHFPLYLVSTLRITITNTLVDAPASCGRVAIGARQFIGASEYGLSTGITDYSKVDENTFGLIYLKPGTFVDRFEGDLIIDNDIYDQVQELLTELRAIPTVFDGNNDSGRVFNKLIVFGFINDWSVVLQNFSESQVSIDIKGIQGLLL